MRWRYVWRRGWLLSTCGRIGNIRNRLLGCKYRAAYSDGDGSEQKLPILLKQILPTTMLFLPTSSRTPHCIGISPLACISKKMAVFDFKPILVRMIFPSGAYLNRRVPTSQICIPFSANGRRNGASSMRKVVGVLLAFGRSAR
jgi:hypothetical protein